MLRLLFENLFGDYIWIWILDFWSTEKSILSRLARQHDRRSEARTSEADEEESDEKTRLERKLYLYFLPKEIIRVGNNFDCSNLPQASMISCPIFLPSESAHSLMPFHTISEGTSTISA